MTKYELVIIVRFQVEAGEQINALRSILNVLPKEATEVLVKDIHEIQDDEEDE